MTRDLAERFEENPLLKPGGLRPTAPSLLVACLLNPGVFRFDGKIWLLLRVAERPEQKAGKISFPVLENDHLQIREFDHDDSKLDLSDPRIIKRGAAEYLTTLSHLRLVSSRDGIHFQEEPHYPPLTGSGAHESYGIEDCRVSQIGADYYLTYTAVSPSGVAVAMRSTRDWRTFRHHGLIFPPHNKDCALFEERINGKYFALHRPSSPMLGGNYIWLAESADLTHWGGHRCLIKTRPGSWDSARVGAGAAPIRTDLGWLVMYHGANEKHRYCLGALLLDLEAPWKVLARSKQPIMEPSAPYECTGFLGNVIFSNGHFADGGQLTIYYGASDSVICGARFSLAEILQTLAPARE